MQQQCQNCLFCHTQRYNSTDKQGCHVLSCAAVQVRDTPDLVYEQSCILSSCHQLVTGACVSTEDNLPASLALQDSCECMGAVHHQHRVQALQAQLRLHLVYSCQKPLTGLQRSKSISEFHTIAPGPIKDGKIATSW